MAKKGVDIKPAHIIQGWAKSLGLMEKTPADKKRSLDRLVVCGECPFAKQDKILLFLRGKGHDILAFRCDRCGCPVNEKSLVAAEQCPEGKWSN